MATKLVMFPSLSRAILEGETGIKFDCIDANKIIKTSSQTEIAHGVLTEDSVKALDELTPPAENNVALNFTDNAAATIKQIWKNQCECSQMPVEKQVSGECTICWSQLCSTHRS